MTNTFCIHNINIVSTLTGGVINDATIYVENGTICGINIGNYHKKIRKIDGKGGWVIPSFIDSHTHVTFDGRAFNHIPIFVYDESENTSLLRGAQNLMEALKSGICLLRDVGAKGGRSHSLKALVDSGSILGPEMILSGEPICTDCGHGYEFGQIYKPSKVIDDYSEGRNHKWLKIMNGPELFDKNHLSNIIASAHNSGFKIAVHAFTEKGIKDAVEVGADTIEHGVAYSERIVEMAIQKGTCFVPTFYCSWVSLHPNYLTTVPAQEVVHLEQWHEFLKKYFSFHVKNNLPTLVGTDAGSSPCTFSDITKEIKLLSYSGFSNLQALQAATISPAKVFLCEDKYGTIENGKWANFILLTENPLQNIHTIDHKSAVWYRGIEITNNIENPWN